ncbi:unnamed protein product [Malus baccata var. baccata]
MEIEKEVMDYLNITFEDNLDLEERFENNIHLVRRLITDNEPLQTMVKEVLRSAWNKMGVVRVQKAKSNAVARWILEGNPWFIRDYTFSVKLWLTYHSLDDIKVDRVVFWIQAHGIPRNFCTVKNARSFGEKIGAVLEVEDHVEVGFKGFLRLRVDFDARRPFITCCSVPCPKRGSYTIILRYEGLRIFYYRCGKLGHARGCLRLAPPLPTGESKYNDSLKAKTLTSHLAGTNRDEECIPTICLNVGHDHGHMWHPFSYGTQFTINTLTIAVNGLCGGYQGKPNKFSIMDCFPPGTNRDDIDARSLQIAA